MRLESAKTRRVSGKLSDVGHLGFLPLILIINIDEPSQYSFLLNLHIASESSLTLCSRKPLPIKGNMVCVCVLTGGRVCGRRAMGRLFHR